MLTAQCQSRTWESAGKRRTDDKPQPCLMGPRGPQHPQPELEDSSIQSQFKFQLWKEGLITRLYKDLLQPPNKKTSSPTKNGQRNLNRCFSKDVHLVL